MAWLAKSVLAAAAVGGVVWAALPSPPPKYLGDGDPLVRLQLPPVDSEAATAHGGRHRARAAPAAGQAGR